MTHPVDKQINKKLIAEIVDGLEIDLYITPNLGLSTLVEVTLSYDGTIISKARDTFEQP